MRIIAIINQKGGCGKTTTAINLAGVLASLDQRTLLVDLDPQSHCAAGLAIPEQRIDIQIGDALLTPPQAPIDWTRLLWRVSRNLDLAPSTVRLAALESSRGGLAGQPDAERRLGQVLVRLADQYDVCLLDCPPTIGLLTYNALAAATEIIIPVETSFFALQGAAKQASTIAAISRRLGSHVPYRILPTIHDHANPMANQLLEQLAAKFADRMLPVVIRRDDKLKEAVSFGQPAIEYDRDCDGAQDYLSLGRVLLGEPARRALTMDMAMSQTNSQSDAAIAAAQRSPQSPVTVRALAVEQLLASPSPQTATQTASQTLTQTSTQTATQASGLGGQAAQLAASGRRVAAQPAGAENQPYFAGAMPARTGTTEPAALARPSAALSQSYDTGVTQGDRHGLPAPALGSAVHESGLTGVRREPNELQPVAAVMNHDVAPMPVVATSRPAAGPYRPSAQQHAFGARSVPGGVQFVQPLAFGKAISIAGDFNNWSAAEAIMSRNDVSGYHMLFLPLPPGKHQYRLVVDGHWTSDPHNPNISKNPFGETNSIIIVP